MTNTEIKIVPAKLLPALVREIMNVLNELGLTNVHIHEEGDYRCPYCGYIHAWEFRISEDGRCYINVCPIKRIIDFSDAWNTSFTSKLPESYKLKGYMLGWMISHGGLADPEPERCEARTTKGTRCKNKAFKGGFCKTHQGYKDQPRAVGNRFKGKLTGMGL